MRRDGVSSSTNGASKLAAWRKRRAANAMRARSMAASLCPLCLPINRPTAHASRSRLVAITIKPCVGEHGMRVFCHACFSILRAFRKCPPRVKSRAASAVAGNSLTSSIAACSAFFTAANCAAGSSLANRLCASARAKNGPPLNFAPRSTSASPAA